MQKRFGLFYSNKDGKQYLHRSCYTLKEVIKTIESDDFQAIEKTSISVVDMKTKDKSEIKEEKLEEDKTV
jgi:hypothetical protein